MRTEKDAPLFATSLTQTVAASVQADVYIRNNKPEAIVLWQGAEPQPFLAVRDSDDGRLQRFTLTANDDVPKHDRRESHLNSVVETRMQGEIIRSIALYEVGVAEPFLAVVGSDAPLRKRPFNDRSNGIFAYGFRDRDGLPVEDGFGYTMRATLHGLASRDWDAERVAALIGEYSSDQMARISEVVAEISRDDQWRLAHQDDGIAGTADLASILHQWPVSTEGAVPLVSVQVETNTFSFFVDETADGAKKVRVHQFTDFRGTILQDDFPLGSSNEWEASAPEGLSNLKAVDHVGRALLKDWDSQPKNYAPTVHIVRTFEAGGPDFRPGLPLGDKTVAFDSLQDALQNFMDTPATDIPRVYVGKKVLVEYDPDDGMNIRFRDSATKAEYIKLEAARLPPYNPDDMTAAVAYANATKALFAKGEHDQAFSLYMHDPNGGGQPAFHQTTKEQFVLGMYSGRDIQGNPLYPQPAGYQHAGVTVGHEVQLQDNAWARIDHVFDFDGKPHVLVESGQGKRLVSVAEVGQMRPAGEQLADPAPSKPTDDQRSAVATFADANGRDWKDKLHALWGNGNYRSRGIDTNQAALLQQVRNEFGPAWLSEVKRADLDAPKRADLDDAGMGM